MASLTFLGAAGTVTGSQYLLEVDHHRILVDCGMFQGLKPLRLRNWAKLPVHPGSVHSVVLTHAHLDHTGLLPRLVSNGFGGRVFCTAGTADLCKLVLPDAGRLQEEDARRANKGRYSRHTPALPLFTENDAAEALTRLQPFGYHRPAPMAPGPRGGVHQRRPPARLVLRSRAPQQRTGGTVLFGGDLGRYSRPVLPDPSPGVACDTLLLESTYGDREHPPDDHGDTELARIVNETVDRKGKLIIPSFAIGRVEEVLYWLKKLEDEAIPILPVYVDSPMACRRSSTTAVTPRARPGRPPGARRGVRVLHRALHRPWPRPRNRRRWSIRPGPAIVISASGMATGGRVLHHLRTDSRIREHRALRRLPGGRHPRARLIEGAHQVKMFGQWVPVQARIEAERHVGARRRRRDPPLAADVPEGAAARLPRARRAARPGRR
jgi:metallo-beta-lactamase family protein